MEPHRQEPRSVSATILDHRRATVASHGRHVPAFNLSLVMASRLPQRTARVVSSGLARLGACCSLLLLAGCPSLDRAPEPTFPREMADVGESPLFPKQAADYTRGKMLMYEPTVVNLSIAYDRFDSELQNAVTLYFYPRRQECLAEFESAKRGLTRAHPGASLVSEKSVELEKGGKTHRGLMATFEYQDVLAFVRQTVSSQLLVVELPRRFFKVRSTAPQRQGALAEAEMLELLEQVAWDNDPD